MKLAIAVVLLAGCSKDPAKAGDPKVIQGPQAAAGDPKNLPAPGPSPDNGLGEGLAGKPTPPGAPAATAVTKETEAMWNVPIKTLQGKDTKLADYKGKALMIVNVASKCGLTPQYTTLEALQKKYEPQGFTVIGFPCNQFGGQEPGTAQEIETFCATKYGVTFPMMEKIDVNGSSRHEIYKALTPIKDVDGTDGDIRWNFEKFVVSADGTKITRFEPQTKPDDPKVIAAIEASLPKK